MIHVVESQNPSAGSISVCLPGLLELLPKSGFQCTAVGCVESWNSQFSSAQVIHIHGWNYPLALHAASLARKSGKPYVLSPLGQLTPNPGHRRSFLQRIRRYLTQRPLVKDAVAVTALNEIDYDSLRAENVHPNLVLLPYGISFQEFPLASTSAVDGVKQEQRLLVLGPLDPLYGCVAMLKAFAELGQCAGDWKVTLAGEDRGNWRGKLEAAIRRKGGESRVTFADARTLDKHRQLLNDADLLVAPSLHVSPAVSIMQAVAAGVPVVATRNAAPPGFNGDVRVCGASRAELRETMRSAMQMSVSSRRKSALASREKAESLFDWSVLAPRYAELYSTCLRN